MPLAFDCPAYRVDGRALSLCQNVLVAWVPINLVDLKDLIERDLSGCPDLRAFFDSVAIEPAKWKQSPWGDEGRGFWALGVRGSRVL